MKLVLVHGRGQAGKIRDALQKQWMDALGYGLLRADKALPASTVVEFPFYGDELDSLRRQIETPLAIDANARGIVGDIEPALRAEILQEIAANMGVAQSDIEREFAGQPSEKGLQNWRWVHAILRAVDRIPGFNSSFIDSFTRDVYLYLAYPAVRSRINRIVAAAIGNERCVVVAHSLGSVVAYNVLLECASTAVPRFITVGSPLGIRAIKNHLATPLTSPVCVGSWFNAYDNRDVVSLVPLDSRGFDVTPPIENKGDVLNFTENRHGIEGYLADPVIAAKIVEVL